MYRSHRIPKLILVGTQEPQLDPLSPKTQQIMEENPNIIQAGWQNDVRPYLAITDVFVFPSYREGMPNVVLQAGAMGLPQIVTNINGSNEIITHGENGLIIPPKDATTLQQALQQLYDDANLRTHLAENARKLIAERFDQKVVWEALRSEYKELIKQLKI